MPNSLMKKKAKAKTDTKPKPKLTDAERHKRFVDMAREVEASNDPKDFDRAFKKVATPHCRPHDKKAKMIE
jgi:hypothetical protein